MSRIGKMPVSVPAGVEITIDANSVTAKGPKGCLQAPLFAGIEVSLDNGQVQFSCADVANKDLNAKFGLVRALLANHIEGVSKGFSKTLELRGVGYRAQLKGRTLVLALGFSHPVEYDAPEGIEIRVDKSNVIISGADKQAVGQVAAEIRAYRPPEPYKGKGVRYADERVVMKEGKKS